MPHIARLLLWALSQHRPHSRLEGALFKIGRYAAASISHSLTDGRRAAEAAMLDAAIIRAFWEVVTALAFRFPRPAREWLLRPFKPDQIEHPFLVFHMLLVLPLLLLVLS